MSDHPIDRVALAIATFEAELDAAQEVFHVCTKDELIDLLVLLTGPPSERKAGGVAGSVSLVAASIKTLLVELMEGKKEQVGGWELERKSGRKRGAWRHPEVWAALERFIDEQGLADAADGLNVVRKAAPSPSWTAEGLRGLGMNPDNFCSAGEVESSLIIRPRIAMEEAS